MITRPRRTLTLALLSATGALTAVLGNEAWDASRSSVRLAEENVRDQALFAASNFAVEARSEVIFELLEEGLDIIDWSLGRRGNRPLSLARLREGARTRRWNAMEHASLFFRLGPGGSEVSVAGDADSARTAWALREARADSLPAPKRLPCARTIRRGREEPGRTSSCTGARTGGVETTGSRA